MKNLFKSSDDHAMSNSRGYWNMYQPPPLDTIFTINGIKYEIKTSQYQILDMACLHKTILGPHNF